MLGLALVAIVTRAVLITSFLTRLPVLYQWGVNEIGVVARSIVLNHTFSSPYHDAVGPTAWLAPLYPGIVALIFTALGVQTPISAIAVIIFNALCSAAVSLVVYKMGSEFFSERVGLIGGLLWAVSPAVATITMIVWDTCLTALLGTCALWLTLRAALRTQDSRWTRWSTAGALWGIAALSSPAVLAPLPFLVLWICWKTRRIKMPAVFSASLCAVLLPWTLRNFHVFHQLIPVRDNFWAEMYWGNLGFATHPLGHSMEYQTLGEQAFIEMARQRLFLYLHQHFFDFMEQTFHRMGRFWIVPEGMWGLSFFLTVITLLGLLLLARRKHALALPFFIMLLVFPVTYYVCYAYSRYRHPIEPIMYLISAFVLVETGQRLARIREAD